MMRRKLYAGMIVLLLLCAGAQMVELEGASLTEDGIVAEETPDIWKPLIARAANQRSLQLSVDGVVYEDFGHPSYMTDEMEVMIPVSLVSQAFSIAENFYDDSLLVLESGTERVSLTLGENQMEAGESVVELDEALTWVEDQLYLPLEVMEKGFGYEKQWSSQQNMVTMEHPDPNRRKLPSYYDYRQVGRAPLVKNQGSFGTCWAFASLTALESFLMPEQVYDFSDDHMSLNNSFNLSQDDGGEYTMSMAYLLGWQGPVLEKDDPYGDGVSPEGLEPVKHVQEIQILPSKDYEKIKEAVFLSGGVQSSLYTSIKNYKSRSVYYNEKTHSYCYIGEEKPNHDAVIVGWDDHYPKENFNMELEGDGAFLCVSSWGEAFGDSGYFYVSYYDTNIGIHNVLYTRVDEPSRYDHIYQTDLCGWVGQLGYGKDTAYGANVYQADSAQELQAVGFYAIGPDTDYEVYVARHVEGSDDLADRELVANGHIKNSGYYTIDLKDPVLLEEGERFAVVVKVTTPGSVHPLAIEYQADDAVKTVDITDGEGYISHQGETWESLEDAYGCNLCLKAYTTNRN